MIEIKTVKPAIKTVLYTTTITAPLDWEPLDSYCHAYCPFGRLIPLGKTCRAIELFKESHAKFDFCPFHNGKFQIIKEVEEEINC